MSKKNNNLKYAGLGGIVVLTLIVFIVFSGSIGAGLLSGNVAQLSIVSGQGKFSCDAWNEIATVTNGVTRVVESNHEGFQGMFDSSLLSLTSNVDALKIRLVLECDDNFVDDSRSTTVSGGFLTRICGSGSPEVCYIGETRFFNNLQGVATSSDVLTFVPITTKQIFPDERVIIWEGSIGRSQIEAIAKEGGVTFTSRMYPQLTFTFDHPTLGVFSGFQDSSPSTGDGDLIYSQYGGVTLTQPPPPDTDGDGITDDKDSCVGQPEDFNNFQDEDGCPDALFLVDTDNDGVSDLNDACPNEVGLVELLGCPLVDDDNDGIANVLDLCVDTVSGSVDNDGCSDVQLTALAVDGDGDGVPDVSDDCPNQFGRGDDGCNIVCTGINEPVCGTDNITYPNECFALNNQVDFVVGACIIPVGETDNDNDGVLDSVDICQSTPPNASVDTSGCELPSTGSIFDDFIVDDDNPVEDFFDDIFDDDTGSGTPPPSNQPQTPTDGELALSDIVIFGIIGGIIVGVIIMIKRRK